MNKLTFVIQHHVLLDGKHAGTIKRTKAGWAYHPKGGYPHGDIFSTVTKVQQSLEEE